MPYGIRIELNGEDITALVSRFEILARLDAYVREISLEVADPDLYDNLDFSLLPDSPALEVLTRVGEDWVGQGKFFIEKPTFQVGLHRTDTGLWGRSETARLGPPFAVRITKTWENATTFFSICHEMCEAAGLAWDDQYSAVSDFTIHARTFTAENAYPVEVIQEILELAHGQDAFLTTDRAGHVVIARRDRAPVASDHTVSDLVMSAIQEEPEWPDFGNRIRISSSGSTSGYSIQVSAQNQCLSGNASSRVQLYARVTDHDGLPAEGVPIAWSAKNGLVSLDSELTNTQSIVIFDEEVRAKSFYEIDLKMPPASVRGIYAYKDTRKSDNFAEQGVEIDGNTVILNRRLAYCDQLLRVTYAVDGVAVNWATAGSVPGTERVTADILGQTGSIELYIENPCHCPPTLTLEAVPSSILVKETSSLLAYVEIGGAPVIDGRAIYMSIDSDPAHGKLEWTKGKVGKVAIKNELCQVRNEIAGVSQTQLNSFPASISGVWRAAEDGNGNRVKTGNNLYASHQGKVVNLTVTLQSETELLADYTAFGAATNTYDGLKPGTDKIRAWIITTREAPAEASVSITVSSEDPKDPDPPPEDCCEEGLCAGEGTPCDSEAAACEEGKVWCLKDGVEGCFAPEECDVCEEGKVACKKSGVDGCWLPEECDATHTDGGTGKKYGISKGTPGCWLPDQLDRCALDRVICFKGGLQGCYTIEECDTAAGVTEAQKCPAGTVCCENKNTGIKGCWPITQCKAVTPKPPKDHDKDPGTECRKDDGSVAKCKQDETCCESGGIKGCWPAAKCDQGAGCSTSSCQEDPSEECLAGRFGGALGKGCSCSELCENEFARYGTTQTNDGSSYRPIEEIVTSDYGLEPGTPAYDEKYDELKQKALDECRARCGECERAPELILSGSDAVTRPGGYQYVAEGGFQPYTWEITGTGVSIDDSGYVTLDVTACGTFTVTVKDACGSSASMGARVTNAGKWQYKETLLYSVDANGCALSTLWGGWEYDVVEGVLLLDHHYTGARCCFGGRCNQGPPSSAGGITKQTGTSYNSYCKSDCWIENNDPNANWYWVEIERRVEEWVCP